MGNRRSFFQACHLKIAFIGLSAILFLPEVATAAERKGCDGIKKYAPMPYASMSWSEIPNSIDFKSTGNVTETFNYQRCYLGGEPIKGETPPNQGVAKICKGVIQTIDSGAFEGKKKSDKDIILQFFKKSKSFRHSDCKIENAKEAAKPWMQAVVETINQLTVWQTDICNLNIAIHDQLIVPKSVDIKEETVQFFENWCAKTKYKERVEQAKKASEVLSAAQASFDIEEFDRKAKRYPKSCGKFPERREAFLNMAKQLEQMVEGFKSGLFDGGFPNLCIRLSDRDRNQYASIVKALNPKHESFKFSARESSEGVSKKGRKGTLIEK